MSGGQLVPHQLPDGRTVMVPDYLMPKGALAMAPAAAPAPAPGRTASLLGGGGGPQRGSGLESVLGQMSPDFRSMQDAGSAPPPEQTPMAPFQKVVKPPEGFERDDAGKEQSAVDPKKLKPVPKADPRAESSVIADTANSLYKPKTGGGKPAAVDPQNLNLVAAEVKQKREPGMRLLPEQKWRLGIEERPRELYELDPDADQPTWGTEDPVYREKLTPLEKGAETAGQYARAEFDRSVEAEREMGIARRQMLAEQSELVDSHLNTIAERRNRIAKLQEVADKRMQEAESFEPRTRSEVWESKGPVAQVMGVLAMAIGGYTQGLGRNGGKNPGWDIINKIIDDEVEGERDRAERRYKVGQAARNDVERAQALYGDLDMAMLEAKNRKLGSVMAMTQQQLSDRALDETAKMRAAQIYEAAKEQYLANKQQLFDQITGKVTEEEATLKPYGQVVQAATPKPTGGGGVAGGITGDKLKGLSSEVRGMAVMLPNGRHKFVRQPTQQAQTQKRVSSLGEMASVLSQIQKWRQDKGKTLPLSEARGRIQNLAARFTMLVKGSEQLGALDKGTMDFMLQMLGSPEQFNVLDETTDGKIRQQLETVNRNMRKIVEEELDDGPFELTEGGVTPDEVKD